MGIKLSCLSCGHSLDLGDAYENYRGAVRCWSCRALLDVTLEEGLLRGMQPSAAQDTLRAEADRRQES